MNANCVQVILYFLIVIIALMIHFVLLAKTLMLINKIYIIKLVLHVEQRMNKHKKGEIHY